ncbi:MAG: flagellar motor switch protein FliM [Bacillota bacterium]|nr:flagellar motor switch protein FliM [Candidatus Fermentithermobacillaceae bacterium]
MALSQKEIEDLINSVIKKSETDMKPQIAKPRLRVYDFRRPDKFSKDHLRGAQLLFDNFSRQLTSYFSALFRMAIHVGVNSVDQITYQEFAKGLANPCCVGVVTWGDLPSNMLVSLGMKVALPMLDRLCGGGGNPPGISRSLTEIELAMSKRVAQSMVDIFRDTLRECRIDAKDLLVSSMEVNPLFVQQALPPNDMVLSVSVGIRFGSQSGTVEFCLPYTLLEPVLPALSASRWFSRGGNVEEDKGREETVSEALEDIEVPLSCRLGGTVLAVQDLLSLEPGDTIDLSAPKDGYAIIYVFGKPKFLAKVGRIGTRLAARIVAVAENGEEDPIL